MNGDYLQIMPPERRADKSRCSNLHKDKGVGAVIVFRGVPHSIPHIQQVINCQIFLDDPVLCDYLM
jgi:hypothetical protein